MRVLICEVFCLQFITFSFANCDASSPDYSGEFHRYTHFAITTARNRHNKRHTIRVNASALQGSPGCSRELVAVLYFDNKVVSENSF